MAHLKLKNFALILSSAAAVFFIQGELLASGKFEQIDKTLQVSFQHARNYPPEFTSQDQRDRVEKELLDVIAQLEHLAGNSPQDQGILFRLGKANTFAYNLDIAGSKDKADRCFKQLFQLNPDHAEGHLYYGQHLSGRGEVDSGITHLQIAADAGLDVALQMIGAAYLQKGNTAQARKYFEAMHKKYPNFPQIKMLLDSLDSSSGYDLVPVKQRSIPREK